MITLYKIIQSHKVMQLIIVFSFKREESTTKI